MIINGLTNNGKHLITKLRSDANLKYLNEKPRLKGQKGVSGKYDGKLDFKISGIPDLSKWVLVGTDEKYFHLTICTQNFMPSILTVFFEWYYC